MKKKNLTKQNKKTKKSFHSNILNCISALENKAKFRESNFVIVNISFAMFGIIQGEFPVKSGPVGGGVCSGVELPKIFHSHSLQH